MQQMLLQMLLQLKLGLLLYNYRFCSFPGSCCSYCWNSSPKPIHPYLSMLLLLLLLLLFLFLGLLFLLQAKEKKTMRVVFNSFFTLFVLSLFSPSFYLRR